MDLAYHPPPWNRLFHPERATTMLVPLPTVQPQPPLSMVPSIPLQELIIQLLGWDKLLYRA
jgi:hypothetical protein